MIICDTREPRPNKAKPRAPDIAKLIQERGVGASWQMLDVGDYQMYDGAGELVLVTRKSSDLLPSLHGADFLVQVGGNRLPGFEAVVGRQLRRLV